MEIVVAAPFDSTLDSCVHYHAFHAKLNALRSAFPPRQGCTDTKLSATIMTPDEVIAALSKPEVIDIFSDLFSELLLHASKHVPTSIQVYAASTDVLHTSLRRVIMCIIGQLAIDAAFAAVNTADMEWLHVLATVNNLMDIAVKHMERALTMPLLMASKLAGTGYDASNLSLHCAVGAKPLVQVLKEDALDCIMHACMVFITGKFSLHNVCWKPLYGKVEGQGLTDEGNRFSALFMLNDTRTVCMLKDACLPHHAELAVRQLATFNIVGTFDD